MFNAANCIGIEAADYLESLGYEYTVVSVYAGEKEMNEEAVFDDRNPKHSELLEEYMEHSITCLEYTNYDGGEILIEWSEGTVRSHSKSVKPEAIERLKEFYDQMMLQFESVDESE